MWARSKPDLRRLAVAVSVQALVQSFAKAACPRTACLRVLTDAQPQVAVQACRTRPRPLRARLRETPRGCPCPCRCLNEHGKTSAHRRATRPDAAPGPRPRIPQGDSRHVHAVPAPRPARRRPALAAALPAAAQSAFPAKPVTLIVPFPAGSRHLRIVAQDASSTWASPSSWKPAGAGGTLGPANMARPPSRTATPFRCTPWPCCACPTCTRPTGIRSTISPSSSACRLYLRLHRARRFSVQNLQRLHRGRAQGPGSIDYGSTGAARRRTC